MYPVQPWSKNESHSNVWIYVFFVAPWAIHGTALYLQKSILFEYAERIKKVATALEEKQRLIEEILQLPHQVDGDDDEE